MSIDPRIALGVKVAPQVNVADIFNRVKQQQQALKVGEQGLEIGEQNIAMNEQAIAQQTGANNDATNNRILKSLNDYAVRNEPQINQAIATGNPDGLIKGLIQRKADLTAQGLPTAETDEGITMLQQGDITGFAESLKGAVNLYNQQNNQGASAGQREFQNLLNIAQDPNSTELEANAAKTALGVMARAGSSSTERIATNQGLGDQVAAQGALEAGAEAQAVSDVKVEEVKTLEQETEGGKQEIESKRLAIDETKIKNEKQKQEAISTKNARREEADSAVAQVTSLLAGDRFSSAFGKLVTNTPDIAKSQKSIDAIADIDQIKGLLTLESRQKLKGQGTISDGEQKILAASATVLNNPLISDELARKELRKIRNVFEASSDRNQLKKETREAPTVIKFDAQGNQIQ